MRRAAVLQRTIITRAEMRMADEIDAGQARGELATRGDDKSPNLGDLGVPSQRVSEWREVRDAGEEVVEQAIQTALDEGRAPTKSDIQKHVRGTFGTGDNEWYTPTEHLSAARDVLGDFDLDPATSHAAQIEISRRRENLSWSHHQEGPPAFPAVSVGDFLSIAGSLGLTVSRGARTICDGA